MNPPTKAELLEAIAELKRTKPEGWKKEVRRYCCMLASREGIFAREHPYRGDERTGRHPVQWCAGPRHDNYDDQSFP
jgi:hypothetical protein